MILTDDAQGDQSDDEGCADGDDGEQRGDDEFRVQKPRAVGDGGDGGDEGIQAVFVSDGEDSEHDDRGGGQCEVDAHGSDSHGVGGVEPAGDGEKNPREDAEQHQPGCGAYGTGADDLRADDIDQGLGVLLDDAFQSVGARSGHFCPSKMPV